MGKNTKKSNVSEQDFYKSDMITLSEYLKKFPKQPLLTREEEYEYIRKIRNGDKEALSDFLAINQRLILAEAKKYTFLDSLETLDLMIEGNFGLMEAIKRFDLSSGNKFSTVACIWIKYYITDTISTTDSSVKIPKNLYWKVNDISKRAGRKFVETGDVLTLEKELRSEMTEYVAEGVKNHLNVKKALSLNAVVKNENGDEMEVLSTIPNNESKAEFNAAEKNCIIDERNKLIDNALNCLPVKERMVLRYRFGFETGDPMTLSEVAKIYRVTPERIRQIEARALKKLRCYANQPLKEYIGADDI